MSSNFKFRLLFLLLAIGFAGTALTINTTINKEEILSLESQKVERRLHRIEESVERFLSSKSTRDSLKGINHNDEWAQYLITEFGLNQDISIQYYENGELKFWNGNRIVLESDVFIREGTTFLRWHNGFYEAIKVKYDSSSVIAFIPIMSRFPYQNEYLNNKVSSQLLSSDVLDIASLVDQHVYHVKNWKGKYLFSMKLRPGADKTTYVYLQLWLWILATLCWLILVTHICISLANRGQIFGAIALLSGVILVMRLLDLEYRWLGNYFDLGIFNPKYYASSYFFPSIGELFINVLSLTWILAFVHAYRFRILEKSPSRQWCVAIFIFILLAICLFAIANNDIFYGLIANSQINFDITNVVNSNWLSWLAVLIFCFAILNLFLFINSALHISDNLDLKNKERFYLFISTILVFVTVWALLGQLTLFFPLFSLILLVCGWAYYRYDRVPNAGVLVFCLFLFSIIGSIKLSSFQNIKENESRKRLASRLEESADPNAVLLFLNIENEIIQDKIVVDYFNDSTAIHSSLTNRLLKLYMAGYLSRYDFKAYDFNALGEPLRADRGASLNAYKSLVLNGAVKVSGYFYRKKNTFGSQHYFAVIPINDGVNSVGTLVLELSSKRLDGADTFPELLIDGKITEDAQLNNYSYAYYNDSLLLNQHGSYVYNVKNIQFEGKARDFVFIETFDKGKKYSHLVYKPTSRKLIVISKEVKGLLNQLASVSFIFLVLLFFSGLIYLLQWIWYGLHNYNMSFRNFRWNYMIFARRMLYKTRIQLSMVTAVVFTLLVTGLITFFNISQQYREQQEQIILDKVSKISGALSNQAMSGDFLNTSEQAAISFNNFADLNGADLNIFDLDGKLIHTTQPKIYENGLIGRRMNAMAYLYLNKLQKSEYSNTEKIGDLSFIAAYIPLRNENNEALGYLGLPSFSNEKDYGVRISSFLNALINVYALVFVAIGFFAVFVANKITSPLTLVQKSLSETKIGRKNEPIEWKRNDEIGSLIKEYNQMIAALEESAQKLARSERETAWREMAKQVAHEIKNPLTPLKLGVQLLDKSYREKDPKFEVKFEKFSKSFIEQIESLAHIASEFSNFAKMPDTVLQGILLKDVIERSISEFQDSPKTTIRMENNCYRDIIINADREQLSRGFNNLIKNAIEARKENEMMEIFILMYCDDRTVFIEFRDNGTGIPEHLWEQIFTPNFTTKSSGTGLGLAFVKQAVENMEGNIRFETASGRGTTFYISIPILKSLV